MEASYLGIRKNVKSLPGFRDLSHSAGMMRLRKAPWLLNSALPLAPAQVASMNPVPRAWGGKYLPIRSPSTWNDLTIRGSSQPILPRARSLKDWAPATRRITGSVHWGERPAVLATDGQGGHALGLGLVHGRGELGPGLGHADAELLELLGRVPDEGVDVALEVDGVGLAVGAGGDLAQSVGVGAVLDPGVPLGVQVQQQVLVGEGADDAGQGHGHVGGASRPRTAGSAGPGFDRRAPARPSRSPWGSSGGRRR